MYNIFTDYFLEDRFINTNIISIISKIIMKMLMIVLFFFLKLDVNIFPMVRKEIFKKN